MRHPNLIDHARSNRQRPTTAESIVWRWLRDRRLTGLKFRRQHAIDDYIADFYCRELKLVVELDGRGHDLAETYAYDVQRTRVLEKYGIEVIRIRNADVRRDPTAACDAIVAAILRRR
jgi:very-short-patch-repair endonuclease